MQLVTNEDVVITLKEITDLLEVRHNDAMKKVKTLAKEPSFGPLRETRISHTKGKDLETYEFTKIQAIAVGAKLNDKLLMKLVLKLEKPQENTLQLDIQMKRLDSLTDVAHTLREGYVDNANRITALEKNRRLEAWQEKALQDAKNKKVYELAPDDKAMASKLHRKVWQLFKKKFHLPRYNELTTGRYEDGLMYIDSLTMSDMVA